MLTKLLQQCFLFFIVVVIPGHNLGNRQVSVNRTIGPSLVGKCQIADLPIIILSFLVWPCYDSRIELHDGCCSVWVKFVIFPSQSNIPFTHFCSYPQSR